MNKQHFKETLAKLVETFERNKDVYRSRQSDFNEAQLREQFLNPMFKALGWDMSNEQGYAEQYKEVVHEDKIYVKGKPKAPDYSFRIGGQRKFFLEAKQPFVRIKTDFDPALQLRRYAWSAHLPISILTDFEEFAIYDTTIEPKAGDSASTSRIEYFTFDQYLDKWEQIYDLFAKDSILKGSFDKYAAKEKKGKQVVDKVFLSELEKWREWLAKDLAKHNPQLSVDELNFSVQKLIDRIIFLRIAEDRGIEKYKTLQQIISNTNSYPELVRYFKRAHDKYNSSLFDFESDTLTATLKVTDQILDKILSHLYYPNSPYEFSVLGVELLGSIYEQFLGKIIRLTDGHNAKVEDKPEVKKAGGVFYTPQYIVEYIVGNTVGELVKDKTPKQVEKLKVLDPACGSGSFLIGAYEYLLSWHLDYYTSLSDSEKAKLEKKGVIYKLESKEPSEDKTVSWHLTTEEKKKIMLNNIYGVDIDLQAVEVTKLSLALKMLENENQETISMQMKLFPDRILPDLSSNIKCGNTLVGSDYWNDKNLGEVSEAEIKKVNAFDWNVEFKQIIDEGGFDAVIGNPPYIRINSYASLYPTQSEYIRQKYSTASSGKIDIYIPFFEKSIGLLKKDGYLSFITPNKFFSSAYGQILRGHMIDNLHSVIDFNATQVFENATTYTAITTLKKKKSESFIGCFNSNNTLPEEFIHSRKTFSILKNKLKQKWIIRPNNELDLLEKIERNGTRLADYCDSTLTGIKTGNNDVFILKVLNTIGDYIEVFSGISNDKFSIEKTIVYPFTKARNIKRYKPISSDGSVVIYPYDSEGNLIKEDVMKANYPRTYQYLSSHRKSLESRESGRVKDSWYGLSFYSSPEMFRSKKIVSPTLSTQNSFTLDESRVIFPQGAGGGMGIQVNEKFDINTILAVLNSKLLTYYMHSKGNVFSGGWYAYEPNYVNVLPVVYPKEAIDTKKLHELVDNLLSTYKLLLNEASESKKKLIQSQVSTIDRQINEIVYNLYKLTPEEINIIESTL